MSNGYMEISYRDPVNNTHDGVQWQNTNLHSFMMLPWGYDPIKHLSSSFNYGIYDDDGAWIGDAISLPYPHLVNHPCPLKTALRLLTKAWTDSYRSHLQSQKSGKRATFVPTEPCLAPAAGLKSLL
ncbi:hypothetical protein KC19_VG339800 [Ceratodon purpureus]|uniref:Uncharacterized protein n=1 Tax=Ceratodon purpureus TaxID=3225 RepID=A0A8T0HXF9_CERPU|nr:hypothetical protein KC19_VG339800 [Ceratodon purpureus]